MFPKLLNTTTNNSTRGIDAAKPSLQQRIQIANLRFVCVGPCACGVTNDMRAIHNLMINSTIQVHSVCNIIVCYCMYHVCMCVHCVSLCCHVLYSAVDYSHRNHWTLCDINDIVCVAMCTVLLVTYKAKG